MKRRQPPPPPPLQVDESVITYIELDATYTERGSFLRRGRRMPARFEPLAAYNAERARGIVHTAEWDARMAALQAQFNDWAKP